MRSFLKYTNKAKTLGIWIIADREELGSGKPKNSDNTFRWALLLIGKNSVNPWTMP